MALSLAAFSGIVCAASVFFKKMRLCTWIVIDGAKHGVAEQFIEPARLKAVGIEPRTGGACDVPLMIT